MKKSLVFLLFIVFIFSVTSVYGQGCSQCKLLTEQGSELDEKSFGSNINIGILYLMVIPYLLILFLFRKRIFSFFKSLIANK
jgi:hypothetical protein